MNILARLKRDMIPSPAFPKGTSLSDIKSRPLRILLTYASIAIICEHTRTAAGAMRALDGPPIRLIASRIVRLCFRRLLAHQYGRHGCRPLLAPIQRSASFLACLTIRHIPPPDIRLASVVHSTSHLPSLPVLSPRRRFKRV